MKITGKNEELSNFIGRDIFNVEDTTVNLKEVKYFTYGNTYIYGNSIQIHLYETVRDIILGDYRSISENATHIENLGYIVFTAKKHRFDLIREFAISKVEVKTKCVKKYWDESTQRGYVKWKKYVFTEEDWQRVLEILPKEQL